MKQGSLFENTDTRNADQASLGSGCTLEFVGRRKEKAILYRNGVHMKVVDLSDRIAKRLFVVEMIELGVLKSRLAEALNMSRQTIHNYLEIAKHFGIEGLIQGYTPSESKSRRKQRELHKNKRVSGDKAELVARIREKERKELEEKQFPLEFSFGPEGEEPSVARDKQPFYEEHDWTETRYAGTFLYLASAISEWKWLHLVMGYFGDEYKIFMIFLLMAGTNTRSIEQLKNIRVREAGIVLGIRRLPCKPKVWEWFYNAAAKQVSEFLLADYFRYQICTGKAGTWVWFTDGHLLPYTGKERVRSAYNTQRRMPVPGRTSMVSCDGSGRIVDFEIQEGKGDLRRHIVTLGQKWVEELPERPVMVFDREGHGAGFFSGLVKEAIPFVTWEKHTDSKKLEAIDDGEFTEDFEFNGKEYSVFEGEKALTYSPEDAEAEKHDFKLRRIYIWNRTSKRRVSGLAWDGDRETSTVDCARAILSRWGASENTFKHLNDRHPWRYHPGFKLEVSDRQEIANPERKEKLTLIKQVKKGLNKLYKKLSKAKEVLNQDGTPCQNSQKERVGDAVKEQETKLESLKEEKRKLPEKINVSTLQDYKSFKRIDNEGKYLFDFVTTSVWNARKQMVDWLRPFFNEENELVDLFYAITNCHGWIKCARNEVIARLEPLQQPKRRLAQEQLCRKLTSLSAKTPSGKRLIIEVGKVPR
jgi:hypothetical protein